MKVLKISIRVKDSYKIKNDLLVQIPAFCLSSLNKLQQGHNLRFISLLHDNKLKYTAKTTRESLNAFDFYAQ